MANNPIPSGATTLASHPLDVIVGKDGSFVGFNSNPLGFQGVATLALDAAGNTAGFPDPLSGGLISYARKARLPKTVNLARQVMATPPTITYTTVHTIVSPILFTPIGCAGGGTSAYFSGGSFAYAKAGLPTVRNTAFTQDNIARLNSVNYGSSGQGTISNVEQWSFITYSAAIEIVIYGYGVNFLVKINDQYISLIPQASGTNAAVNYYYIPFGSSDSRRVDVIINGGNGVFGGVFTAATENVYPAPIRGSTFIMFGDSFMEGGTTTYGSCEGVPALFGEALGWDNVVSSAVGATGFLANPNGKFNYRQRLSTDLTPWATTADYVFFECSSFNDAAFTIPQLQAEWALTVAAAKVICPGAVYGFVGPMSNGGPSKTTQACWAQHVAAKAFCAANGMLFISAIEQRLQNGKAPYTTTLTTSPAQNTTTFNVAGSLTPGEVYAFTDGTRFRCLTSSGLPPSSIVAVSGMQNAQTAGATITQVGQSLWSGTGSNGAGTGNSSAFVQADGIHPTSAGAKAIAVTLANEFILATLANTAT